MLSKTVQENQRDWDQQLPIVMFVLFMRQLATPTFGRSPLLPVDIMLGVHRQKEQEVPVYVTDTHRALQKAYTNVRQCLQAHKRNKSKLCHSSLPCW